MIGRYVRPVMGRIWTEERRLQIWLEIELAVCEALAARGQLPADEVRILRARAKVDPARVAEIEAEVKHDVIAFVTAAAESAGPPGRFLHLGLTSSDVIDTAFAVQLGEAAYLLLEDVEKLLEPIRKLADEHRHTVMMGRTHGVHAELITFGLKVASWYAEFVRAFERLRVAADEIATAS